MGVALAAGLAVKGGLWRRIKQVALTDVGVLIKGLDSESLAGVEQTLLEADFGPAAFAIVEDLESELRRGRLRTMEAARGWLRERILAQLPVTDGADITGTAGSGPVVVVVLGVNGVGKTTTIAKLARRLIDGGRTVLVAAADTFRAGATEQLQHWARRLDIDCIVGPAKGDPAAVGFAAIEAAQARGTDVVLIDTAGRLHTHGDLMEELAKIVRVVGRKLPGAPHESLLVLDGTVGQNALQQGRVFAAAVPLTGLVITKLDGTARGGSVLQLRRELDVPIRYVGVGEALDDLEPFDRQLFVEQLLAD